MQKPVAVFVLSLVVSACGGGKSQQAAPALAPANPQAVSKLAQGVDAAKEKSGRKRAIELLQNAVAADAQLWEGRYNLGVLLAEEGDLGGAEKQLAEAHKLAPNAEDVVVALGEVRRRLGDYDAAADALDAFVKQHPESTLARTALVTSLREAGEIDRAIKEAQAALIRNANDPYALSELALAQLERGEIDTAELLSKEALKAVPPSAVAERTAGLISLKKGDDAVAFRHFQRAGEIDPEDTTARLNIGTVLLRAGVYDRAATELKAVVDADPDDNDAAIALAAALRGRTKRENVSGFGESERLLKGVLEREPKNLSALFNLAVLYADYMKRPNDAEPFFKRFLSAAPDKHPARAEAERFLSAKK